MKVIAKEVHGLGQRTPLFHIFSETELPCPSLEDGVFPEFPEWAVAPDEIRECHSARPPDDCPEKQAGGDFCYPHHTGIFRVPGEPIIFNVGGNVVQSLMSMISADAVVMGCSAFGQLAGILSKGIKLFSTGCEGNMTWEQNKMAPLFAIAELGELWVPLEGSWADPTLTNVGIFRKAFELYVEREEQQ
ncbi:unnamed protein product [Ectocarpus sp. CCAP 1310/34]|nr:unnamed protein product [Ectocarpus sp. CCAP 1310/34]